MSRDSNSQLRDIVYEGGGLPEITIKKLQAYITSKVNEARIDELEKPRNYYLPVEYSDHYKNGFSMAIEQVTKANDDRIKSLQSQGGK